MKGLIVKKKSNIELVDNLEIPAPKEGEILIKVHSASVNPFDLESAAGTYDSYFKEYGFDKPVQTGLEVSGIVQSDGTHFKEGDAVYGYVHLITGWKAHAEFITLPESYLAPIPEGINFEEAAALPVGLMTTLAIYDDLAPRKKKLDVLIVGAAGGVGVYATQLGKIKGHNITTLAGPDHEEFLAKLGADNLYNYEKIDLLDLPGNYDLILDFSTRLTLNECLPLLSDQGKFIPALPDDQNGGTLEDAKVGYLMVMHGDTERLKSLNNLLHTKKIKTVIEKTFKFKNYQRALEHLQQKGKKGRIVLSW